MSDKKPAFMVHDRLRLVNSINMTFGDREVAERYAESLNNEARKRSPGQWAYFLLLGWWSELIEPGIKQPYPEYIVTEHIIDYSLEDD